MKEDSSTWYFSYIGENSTNKKKIVSKKLSACPVHQGNCSKSSPFPSPYSQHKLIDISVTTTICYHYTDKLVIFDSSLFDRNRKRYTQIKMIKKGKCAIADSINILYINYIENFTKVKFCLEEADI